MTPSLNDLQRIPTSWNAFNISINDDDAGLEIPRKKAVKEGRLPSMEVGQQSP
jgi:hypothetical protein